MSFPNPLTYLLRTAGAFARSLLDRLRERVSVKDFGAVGDGSTHPLSSMGFSTLGAAQAKYPCAVALSDEIDWAAAQTAADYCMATATAAKLHFPAGRYLFNRSLSLPRTSNQSLLRGLCISGAGAHTADPMDTSVAGAYTVIFWNGSAASGPIIQLTEAQGVVFRDLTLCGKLTAAGNQCSELIGVDDTAGGLGTGVLTFQNVWFARFTVAVRFAFLAVTVTGSGTLTAGETISWSGGTGVLAPSSDLVAGTLRFYLVTGDVPGLAVTITGGTSGLARVTHASTPTSGPSTNCSDVTFHECAWDTGTQAVVVNNTQGCNFVYVRPVWIGVATWIKHNFGGQFYIYGGSASGGGAGGVYCIDHLGVGALATNLIHGLRVEQGCVRILRQRGHCNVSIDGFTEAQDDTNTEMFKVNGGLLTLRGSWLKSHDATTRPFTIDHYDTSGDNASVLIENTHFETTAGFAVGDWFSINAGPGASNVRVSNCTRATNEANDAQTSRQMPDLCNKVSWGGKYLANYSTTGDTGVVARFDGATENNNNSCSLQSFHSSGIATVRVSARQSGGTAWASWEQRYAFYNEVDDVGFATATMTLVAVGTNLSAGSNGGAVPVGWNAVVTGVNLNQASNSKGLFRVTVTGGAAITVKWRVEIDVAEALAAA